MRPFQRYGRGLEAILEFRDRSGGPSKDPGGGERPFWTSGSGQEALPKVRKAHTEVRKGLGAPLKVQKGSRGPP